MEKEKVYELNLIREYLEISKEDFIEILISAKARQMKSTIEISNEMLFEIIKDALSSYDDRLGNGGKEILLGEYLEKKKSANELVERAIKNLGL